MHPDGPTQGPTTYQDHRARHLVENALCKQNYSQAPSTNPPLTTSPHDGIESAPGHP